MTKAHFEPAYLAPMRSGELADRAARAREMMEDCVLCARHCRVNRLEGVKGAVCRTGEKAVVSSHGPHVGEEDPLRGTRGSGTIFFTWCNLRCVFCQNWDISQAPNGRAVGAEELAAIMLALQAQGCHNINFVSPSHVVAQILDAVNLAAQNGLELPLVYNTGGFDSAEGLALLDGVVDIYMPDVKYGDDAVGRKFSKARGYAAVNQAALKEMHRQVGDLVLDGKGIAERGLLARHLVLPGGLAGTEAVLRFIAEDISPNTYVNIMGQYRPSHNAGRHPEIARRPDAGEMREAFALARRFGLARLDSRWPGMAL